MLVTETLAIAVFMLSALLWLNLGQN
jgi:hypothetical protein